METLRFCKTRLVKSPARAHVEDAGIDWFVPEDLTVEEMRQKDAMTGHELQYCCNEDGTIKQICLQPGQSVLIPSGIKVEVPNGYALIFQNKSGVASKKSLLVGSSVVDIGYEGICHFNLHNASNRIQTIVAGEKIVQSVMHKIGFHVPVEVPESELYAKHSSRGEGGFGSTN